MDGFSIALLVASVMAVPIVFLIVRGTRNLRERELKHKERMRALELGVEVPEELAKNGNGRSRGSNPGMHGVIWAGVGAGLIAARSIIGEAHGQDAQDLYTFATFLMIWGVPALFVGVGLITYSIVSSARNSIGSGSNDS